MRKKNSFSYQWIHTYPTQKCLITKLGSSLGLFPMKIGRSRVMLIAAEGYPWFPALSDPRGVLLISSDRDDPMGDKNQNPPKSLGLQTKPKKFPGPNLNPKKIPC